MGKSTRFVILGAGNGGQSIAGDLAERGAHVAAIYDRFPEAVEPVRKRGGVDLVGPVRSGFGKVDLATTDIGEAMAAGEFLFVVVPAFAHEWMAESMAPHLRDGQIIVIVPGYCGGALLFQRIFQEKGPGAQVTLAEAISLPYATRLVGSAQAGIKGLKKELHIATLPRSDMPKVLDILQPALPQPRFVPAESVLVTGLNNLNPMGHVPFYLMNLGRIESDLPEGHFDWHDWVTPKIKLVSQAIDRERIQVAEALDVPAFTAAELNHLWYAGEPWKIIQPTGEIPPSSETIPARYITEDVPHGLVPTSVLGRSLDVATPVTTSLVNLASVVQGVDYWKEGRSLEKMGLAGLTADEIKALV